MKKMVTLSLAALMSTAMLGLATPAAAQPGYYGYNGHNSYSARYDCNDRRYDRRDYRADRRYNNNRYDRRNYRQCDSGTGGTIIGAIAGGLAGHEIAGRNGDRTMGTIIGGAVGAVAGRAIDKSDDPCRRRR